MFGSTNRTPETMRRSFATNRRRSLAAAVGRRMPIEFTHSTRFRAERIRMMCFLLVGSPSQSWEMQIIDCTSIMTVHSFQHACRNTIGEIHNFPPTSCAHRFGFHLLFQWLWHLTVDGDPLPHFQVHQEPQTIRMRPDA